MAELLFTTLRTGAREGTPVLSIHGLTVRVGIRRVIELLDLDVFDGDMIRISGPNGCGKSTLLNAIAGLDPAVLESGSIRLDGEELAQLAPHERARRGLAFLRQRDNVFVDLSVDDNLRLSVGPTGPARFREAFPAWATAIQGDKQAGLLSGGQKQRLAWAMATLRPSRMLLADEPEAGVSLDFVYPANKAVLLVSHVQIPATAIRSSLQVEATSP